MTMTFASDFADVAPRFSFARLFKLRRTPAPTAETCRARRDFVLKAMDTNPSAFASEEDVAQMLYLYPGRF